MLEGLANEDVFVVLHEQVMTDTAAFADVVLPATTHFEIHDVVGSYGAYVVQENRRVIEPVGESRSNGELAEALAVALGDRSASGLMALGSAHAQLIISSIPDAPDPVPAGGTVTYTVRVAETNGTPLAGGAFGFSVPANGQYAGTGALPPGVSCSGMAEGQTGPGLLNCSGIDLGPNAVAQVPLRVRSTLQGTLSVTATPTPGGAAQTELTTVNAGADLDLSLSAPANASAGSTQSVAYDINNTGQIVGASVTREGRTEKAEPYRPDAAVVVLVLQVLPVPAHVGAPLRVLVGQRVQHHAQGVRVAGARRGNGGYQHWASLAGAGCACWHAGCAAHLVLRGG